MCFFSFSSFVFLLFAFALLLLQSNATQIQITRRSQSLQGTGRIRWSVKEVQEAWVVEHTAILIVDMWDKHWCPSLSERVEAIAMLVNQTITVARNLGMQIIHAPSDCQNYGPYQTNPARTWVRSLPNYQMPSTSPIYPSGNPAFPINAGTGCEIPGAPSSAVWTHETDLIYIDPHDALMFETDGSQVLWNILQAKGIKNLMYVGVHENMCVMSRTFAIEQTAQWVGLSNGLNHVVIGREATDTAYDPSNAPYVEHLDSIDLMTGYIEKFWASSISIYDIMNYRQGAVV